MSKVQGKATRGTARLLGAFALVLPLIAAAQVKMNLADPYLATEFMSVNMQRWADDIRAASGTQITIHWNSSLFKNPDIKRAVQTGQVELGTQLMQNLGPEKRLFELDGLPFLVRNYDEGMKLWEVSRPYLEAYMEKQGLKLLYAVPWPTQGFFFKKEVNALADIAGQRQRAYNEMTSRLAQLMNTVPTTVQITELPQAMTTGTVQCFNTSPTTAVVQKVWEFTTHFYDTEAWLPKQMLFMNVDAWKKLPAATQKAFLEASKAAEPRGWKMSFDKTDEARKILGERMKVLKPSAQLQGELQKIGESLRTEWLGKADEDARKVVAEFLKATGR